jgi:hypothetical protein
VFSKKIGFEYDLKIVFSIVFKRKVMKKIYIIIAIIFFSFSYGEEYFVKGRIMGGIGNQLFQVAAASSLAWENNATPIFPGISTKSNAYKHILFRCDISNHNANIGWHWYEPSFAYHEIPYYQNMDIYGYFQSEKYFFRHKERIIELFQPNSEDLKYMKHKYSWLINYPHTVGIQIRYYLEECAGLPFFIQYGKDYLEKSMSLFPKQSLFVVSSNNIKFAKQSIPNWAKNVIFLEGEPDYIDFYLLSFCKNNIITNSSFGWWAAYLNRNPDKIVIRPKIWLKGFPDQDRCPDNWVVIEAETEKLL